MRLVLAFLSLLLLPPTLLAAPSTLFERIPQTSSSNISVSTPLGNAKGRKSDGVARFVVKYGSALRWQPSTISLLWTQPAGDPTAPPPVCLQPNTTLGVTGPAIGSEDCLYMVIYVPLSGNNNIPNNLPVFTYIHGGSFVVGGTTDIGLDATALAKATNSIVVIPQYRLGVLGWLAPSPSINTNLGAKDVLTALKFLKLVISSFGGDNRSITLAGQSSGATVIKGLLAAPSAASYFKNAILHSDPMAYGFNTPAASSNLSKAFFGNASCTSFNPGCYMGLSKAEIIRIQNQLYLEAATVDPTTSGPQPIRIVKDGSFITKSLTGSSFPSTLKPLLVTTTNADAGPAIFGTFTDPIPGAAWPFVLQAAFGVDAADAILSSTYYPPPPPEATDLRPSLVPLGTDQIWRCPTWTFSRAWAQRNGKVYTAQFNKGTVYPLYDWVPICSDNMVCHQGEIEIVFGTTPSPTPSQVALTAEIHARFASFMRTSNPNASGYNGWSASGSSDVKAKVLGGSGLVTNGGCTVGFFGGQVPYYYQIFGQ